MYPDTSETILKANIFEDIENKPELGAGGPGYTYPQSPRPALMFWTHIDVEVLRKRDVTVEILKQAHCGGAGCQAPTLTLLALALR